MRSLLLFSIHAMMAVRIFAAGPGGAQPAYSNTLGTTATAYGAGVTVADDLSINVADGCQLSRIEFDVSGNTDGKGVGPFAVDFELFDDCPGVGGQPISGTRGHVDFPNEKNFTVTFAVPDNPPVTIPRTVWLAVTFNRDHAGWVGGAPALAGYSDDWFYGPFLGCGFTLGGYPAAPHSSMNARLYVRGACPAVHAAYHVKTPRRGPFNPGAAIRMADDITLDGPCQMIGYEVTVRGTATYEMDLRAVGAGGFPGQLIDGTSRSVQHFGSFIRTLRQTFEVPISLPPRIWFTISSTSSLGRTLIAGLPARIGGSDPGYAVFNGAAWTSQVFPVDFANGAFEVTVLCAGPAVMGACCDMRFTENGDAVCREVPRANCPYPAPGSDLLPVWREGDTCAADPFNPPCGTSACCRADGSCSNLSQSDCAPRGTSWTQGFYCGSPDVDCEDICVLSDEPCTVAHTSPGCIDSFCCADVCSIASQAFCCQVAWDAGCVAQAAQLCGLPPANDDCFGDESHEGARLVTSTTAVDADTLNATESPSDPGFCCHGDAAGRSGFGTVWFRFVASSTSARIRTCTSSTPASDSLLQAFESNENGTGELACATLRLIGCNDDTAGCSSSNRNSQLCLRNLTPGKTYYVMVAAKTPESRGLYKLSIVQSCTDTASPSCPCPDGPVHWVDPPSGAVDARRPHLPANAEALEGMDRFIVDAPWGSIWNDCWTLCETARTGTPNDVQAVSYISGQYHITLERPITPGAVTTLMLNGNPETAGIFFSHPANINGDSASLPADLLDLIDTLNGQRFLPWELLSGDIDHSGVIGPSDLIETIDLLNGIAEFDPWIGSIRADPSPCTSPP